MAGSKSNYAAKKILEELLGGELSVRSAPGDGTTISVAVPAMHRPPREVPVTAEPATKAAASATVSVGATGPQR